MAEREQGSRSPFFIDPGAIRNRWLESLTRASDLYLRSRWFSGAMRLGFVALRGAHSLQTGAARLLARGYGLDENPSGSGAARRT